MIPGEHPTTTRNRHQRGPEPTRRHPTTRTIRTETNRRPALLSDHPIRTSRSHLHPQHRRPPKTHHRIRPRRRRIVDNPKPQTRAPTIHPNTRQREIDTPSPSIHRISHTPRRTTLIHHRRIRTRRLRIIKITRRTRRSPNRLHRVTTRIRQRKRDRPLETETLRSALRPNAHRHDPARRSMILVAGIHHIWIDLDPLLARTSHADQPRS